MLSISWDMLILIKNQQRSLPIVFGPSSHEQDPPEKTDWLRQNIKLGYSKSVEVRRKALGIARSASYRCFAVQTSKTGILGPEITSWSPKAFFPHNSWSHSRHFLFIFFFFIYEYNLVYNRKEKMKTKTVYTPYVQHAT